jgi:hypothetical protein
VVRLACGQALVSAAGQQSSQAAVKRIVLKLEPGAKIRGRVLDKNGEPIEGLNVQLLARVVLEERRQWQQQRSATTDETGAYLVDNLTPGAYAIHSLPLAKKPLAAPGVVSEATPSQLFPSTYYPDAPDLSSAQPPDVKAGQEQLDLSLAPMASFQVGGVVGRSWSGDRHM